MNKAAATKLTNPFVGLRAFEENEDYLFFGRSAQINELLKILSQSRFLAVIGASGSGKSSLVKSGLLPAIYSGFMTVGSNWRAVTMRPGEDPIGYLTKALATEDVLYPDIKESDIPYDLLIEASLRRSENGLVQVYKDAHLPPKENLLIVVDQFEELFRFSRYEKENNLGKSDAMHFIQILLAAVQQKDVPIYVLLTMRADFLGDCAEFRGLPEAINEAQYLVPRMKRDEIREAITGPVAVSRAAISQRLVTRLLNDLNNDTDQLPILQHAMMRTWDAWYERGQHHTPIDLEDYEKIGTMKAALSLHANEVYAELSPDREQKICELMFKALTDKAADVRGIRRPRSIADLCELTNGSEPQVKRVVEVFRKQGRTFLMPPPDVPLTAYSIIDISHESLMRVWDRLVKWIEEEARNGDVYLRLANSAQLHEQGQRGLLKNPELEIALRWNEQTKPTAKWADGYKANFEQAMVYLEDSRKEDLAEREIIRKRARNRRRLMVGFLIFLTGVAGTLAVLTQKAKRAEKSALESADIAKAAQQRDSLSRVKADSLKGVAIKERNNALESADSARAAQIRDSLSKIKAENLQGIAEASEKQARDALLAATESERRAKESEGKAVKSEEDARRTLKRLAFNEYARLIREGPSDENDNRNKFYGQNYFMIYANHFNNLRDSISSDDERSYASAKEKLYYNNDLYKRIYEAASDPQYKFIRKEIIQPVSDQPVRPSFSSFTNGANAGIEENSNGLRNIVYIDKGSKPLRDTLNKRDGRFLALAMSRKKGLILGSTENNLIYVFDSNLHRVDTIQMGARVTALDFFDSAGKAIIYFGTASGYIGYISYDAYKKQQPVFENKLESEITAIELLTRSYKDKHTGENVEETFLLAAAKSSSPRLYKLDPTTLKPDKLLLGNELPYDRKLFGNITGAVYDGKKVVLFTQKKINYAWNPFTDELLKKLNDKITPEARLVNELKFY